MKAFGQPIRPHVGALGGKLVTTMIHCIPIRLRSRLQGHFYSPVIERHPARLMLRRALPGGWMA